MAKIKRGDEDRLRAAPLVIQLMEFGGAEKRRQIIRQNLDELAIGVSPFLRLLLQKTDDKKLHTQTHLNGMLFTSEIARELATAKRFEEAAKLAREDLYWARNYFSSLPPLEDEERVDFVMKLVLIHGAEYERLGLSEVSWQAYCLIDPVFEAVEIAAQELGSDSMGKNAMSLILGAEVILEQVGLRSKLSQVRRVVGQQAIAQNDFDRLREQARERCLAHWTQLPAANRSDGLNEQSALPFKSFKVARHVASTLRCPECLECGHSEVSLMNELISNDEGRPYLNFLMRCKNCSMETIVWNRCPSSMLLGFSPGDSKRFLINQLLNVREYFNYLRSCSPIPLAEDEKISAQCKSLFSSIQEAIPDFIGHELTKNTNIDIAVIAGMFGPQISPFCHQCSDGSAIVVPEFFVIRLFRFTRLLLISWGVSDGSQRLRGPAISAEHAKELYETLYSEFWGSEMKTIPLSIPEDMTGADLAILENCLTFMIGHEVAHIYHGHMGHPASMGVSPSGAQVYDSPQDEIDADQTASRLARVVAERDYTDPLVQIFAMAPIDIFFTVLTLIEAKFPPDPQQHPPAHFRRAALRSQVGAGITSQALLFAIGAQQALEANAENQPHKPDLPKTLCGDWQKLEAALGSLSRGEEKECLKRLIPFLICQPSNDEGWQLVPHILLNDSENKGVVSPRRAIPASPELTDGTLTINLDQRLTRREMEMNLWIGYVKDLAYRAEKKGGFQDLSLDDELRALRNVLLRLKSRLGPDRSTSPAFILFGILEKGILREFTYFARFTSLDRPGFAQFRESLLSDPSSVRELLMSLVVSRSQTASEATDLTE